MDKELLLSRADRLLLIYALTHYQAEWERTFSKHLCKCKPGQEQCIHDHECDSMVEDIKWLIARIEELK